MVAASQHLHAVVHVLHLNTIFDVNLACPTTAHLGDRVGIPATHGHANAALHLGVQLQCSDVFFILNLNVGNRGEEASARVVVELGQHVGIRNDERGRLVSRVLYAVVAHGTTVIYLAPLLPTASSSLPAAHNGSGRS